MSEEPSKEAIQNWWAANPMTYGTVHGDTEYQTESGSIVQAALGSREFYEQVDRTFYSWNQSLHTDAGFFAKIFPYNRFHGKQVLEIGCGMGTMAMNWSRQGAHVTAVDLNPVAIEQTRRRFELFGLQGDIRNEDATALSFTDNRFDYVYSWGVLHHSPRLDHSIREVFRVLRPNGEFGIMLYHRRSFLYWFSILFLEGVLHGESKFLDALQLASRYTDGDQEEGNPYTWPVTRQEMTQLFAPYSENLEIRVLGEDLDGVLGVAFPKAFEYFPRRMKKALARRWGWSLWIAGRKR